MRIVLHIICLLIVGFSAVAQHCYTDQIMEQQLDEKPALAQGYAFVDSLSQAFDRGEISAPASRSFINIPVVVHILWRTEEQNLSDERVKSQIRALNRDFNMDTNDWSMNPEPFIWKAASANIRFYLANIDPQGNPTTGIIRKQVNETSIGTSDSYYRDAAGGSTGWTRTHYLNIWVGETNDSILGYAIYPNPVIGERDGIVMNYRVFGMNTGIPVYNDGRTCVHEVGHYFGLRHPWGNDDDCSTDDYINDTPRQQAPNFVCPDFPSFSCPDEENGDLYVNYMDYGSDGCVNMFTYRQVEYMHLLISTLRSALYHSPGLSGVNDLPVEKDLSIYPNPGIGHFIVEASAPQSASLFSMSGQFIGHYNLDRGQNPVDLSMLDEGVYFMRTEQHAHRIVIGR